MDYTWNRWLAGLVLINTLILYAVNGLQQFLETPQDKDVIKGKTVVLRCVVENKEGDIQWAKDGLMLGYSRNIPGFLRYSVIGNTPKEFNLQIVDVRLDDDARYECQVAPVPSSNNPGLIAGANLQVLVPPNMPEIIGHTNGSTVEVLFTQRVLQLTCIARNARPAATIKWLRNGIEITNGTQYTVEQIENDKRENSQSVLMFEPRYPADNGAIFTCQALNKALVSGPLSFHVNLSVQYPPHDPSIYGYNEGDSIRAGQLLRMTCRCLGGNPPATLQWYKDNELITTGINNKTIGNIPASELVLATEAADNNAIYRCEATNRATTTPRTAVKKLTVHFPPAAVKIKSIPEKGQAGQKLTLICESTSSNPAAMITWIYKEKVLQGTDLGLSDAENGGKSSKNKLEILPTPDDHGLTYGCRATNLVPQEAVHDGITLDILFKPVFSPDLDEIVINEGESRVINLTARANPPDATYTLLRDNMTVTTDEISSFVLEKGELTVSSIARDHGGTFVVEASNTEGVTRHEFKINVQYPAEIYESETVEAEVGGNAEMKCLVRANPMAPQMVSWSREGFDMTRVLEKYEEGVGTLLIETVEKTDSGKFTCTAHNGIGTEVSEEVELVVKISPVIDQSPEYQKAASEAGLTGKLICKAEGAPTVGFKWQKEDGTIIEPNPDVGKYELKENKDTIYYENILLIKNVEKSDYGVYTCIVTNEKGDARFSIRFHETTKPDAPYDISFMNATHNSITIKWKKSFNGGLDESFRVRYEQVDRPGLYVQVDVQPRDSTVFTVKGLALGTEYELTVMAFNDLGGSQYQPVSVRAKTSNLKPAGENDSMETKDAEDTPVMIILGVCIVGVFLFVFNIILIIFFVRRRKKRMENGSDTTSHTNTIELYEPSKETALYPMTPSDESRSYGTYDKNMDDDFSDDYKSYEDDDVKRVFLPPPEYGEVTYSHNNMDSPTFEHRHPIHTDLKHPYNGSDTDSCRKSPWRYEDAYKSNRGKGSFDPDHDYHHGGHMYEPNGHAGGFTRPKSITEMSERSSRPSSRGAPNNRTPPPPPVRSSSKGAADNIPPLPARNYGSQEHIPRYGPPPGSLSSFGSNANVIANPNYDGPGLRTPSPLHQTDPNDDMRGHLV